MNLQNILSKFGLNPKKVAMNIIGQNSNPMLSNLMSMAKNGNKKGIENFAKNLLQQQGRDFDTEFSSFMDQVNKMR